MRIAVLGAGAMGSLFGALLSPENDVTLIDVKGELVSAINSRGVMVTEPDGSSRVFRPKATTDAQGLGVMDLIIIFVKSPYTMAALGLAAPAMGKDTYVMSLQNGMGHEGVIRQAVAEDRIIIGTTQHNASVASPGHVRHGGSGVTYLGMPCGETPRAAIAALNEAGLTAEYAPDIARLVWKKLFTNASASALTGVLQVKLGFLLDSESGRELTEKLVREAVAVAAACGVEFDADAETEAVLAQLARSREGVTSICADIKNGRRTEAGAISGAVVGAARKSGVPAPTHEAVYALLRALEDRNKPE